MEVKSRREDVGGGGGGNGNGNGNGHGNGTGQRQLGERSEASGRRQKCGKPAAEPPDCPTGPSAPRSWESRVLLYKVPVNSVQQPPA
jgi:hypothetical protein